MSNVPHSPLCMCQVCQDEAMAIELRAGAGEMTRIKGDLNAMRLERDTYRAKYEVAIERARSAEAELEGMRYYNDVLECRLETAREEAARVKVASEGGRDD